MFEIRKRIFCLLLLLNLVLDSELSAYSQSPVSQHQQVFHTSDLFLKLLMVALLIVITAFFSLAEYGMITVRRTRLNQLAEEHNRAANDVLSMLKDPTRLMATIQIGVTLLSTLSSALAAASAVSPLTQWIKSHFPHLPAGTLALLIVTIPVAAFTLVVGEIVPKSIAVRYSEKVALLAVKPLMWTQTLLTPAVAGITLLSKLLLRPFGGAIEFAHAHVNEEEIKIMVDAGEEQGSLEPEEKEMIHSVLDFTDTVARKVMTPRIDVTACSSNSSIQELVGLIQTSGHSRIPVYEGDLDNIIGVVNAKDLLAMFPGDGISLNMVIRPPYIIPETKMINELLTEFRHSHQQIAIVRDEYGVTSGIVTIEDLLEEIVGDIQDEYDVDEPMMQTLDDYTVIMDGRISLSEVNDKLGLEIDEEAADTIGGYVFSLLGRHATLGDTVEYHGSHFVVAEADSRRILKIRYERQLDPKFTEKSDPEDL